MKATVKRGILVAVCVLLCTVSSACSMSFSHKKSEDLMPHLIAVQDAELEPVRPVQSFEQTERISGAYTERQQMDELVRIVSQGKRPDLSAARSGVQKVYDAALTVLNRYIRNDFTPFERVHVIHDWLAYYVRYDFETAQKGQTVNGSAPAFGLEGALINRLAVCDGFAKAAALLCGIEGIPCVRVTGSYTDDGGNEIPHAWNQVQINGTWYHMDVTQDCYHVYIDNATLVSVLNHGYFLVSDDAMSDELTGRHYIDEENGDMQAYYACPENYPFHAGQALGIKSYTMEIKSQAELNDIFVYAKKKKGRVGRLELKLNFPEYAPSNLTERDAYVSQIREAYKRVKDTHFAFRPDDGIYPYYRYPNGVFVFLLYK